MSRRTIGNNHVVRYSCTDWWGQTSGLEIRLHKDRGVIDFDTTGPDRLDLGPKQIRWLADRLYKFADILDGPI